jgi:hypothetical protein
VVTVGPLPEDLQAEVDFGKGADAEVWLQGSSDSNRTRARRTARRLSAGGISPWLNEA